MERVYSTELLGHILRKVRAETEKEIIENECLLALYLTVICLPTAQRMILSTMDWAFLHQLTSQESASQTFP